jgi:ATP-dependent exoDNAse (exonuclease V) beta subunit
MPATDRGVLVHELLERLDFRRPVRPTRALIDSARERAGLPGPVGNADAQEIAGLVERFGSTELCARLARATQVAREERFAFPLGERAAEVLIVGAMDVFAREPDGRVLVVDYKSDRLEGAGLAELAGTAYGIQRLVYAVAALRAGATEVEVAHLFLERPDEPVTVSYAADRRRALEAELAALAGGVLARNFPVTDEPQRSICQGCPAEDGLCSWPLEMTRRGSPDRLF